VIVLRQRQSRVVSAFDEVVYYSVARKEQQESPLGQAMRETLEKYGVSSEQMPMVYFVLFLCLFVFLNLF
jgi:hypothetical protein